MQEICAAMGNMAVLYERDANRERCLVESEEHNARTLTEIKQQIVRVHQCPDQMNIAVREKVSSVREEFQRFGESHRQETTAQIDKAIKETKSELDGWINRARGGWFIGSYSRLLVQPRSLYTTRVAPRITGRYPAYGKF